jgi:hypothetical protein
MIGDGVVGSAIFFIIAVIGIAALTLVLFFIKRFLVKRALAKVVRIFREHDAMEVAKAKTVDELGLRRRNMVESLGTTRDYKQQALSALLDADIVRIVEGNRIYLVEDKLAEYNLKGW